MEKRNCIVCREGFEIEEWHDETDDICDTCLKLVTEDLDEILIDFKIGDGVMDMKNWMKQCSQLNEDETCKRKINGDKLCENNENKCCRFCEISETNCDSKVGICVHLFM